MSVDHATRHRFTVDEFHRMGDAGILSDQDRVELINGEIVEMAPIGSQHATCVRGLHEWLQRQVPAGTQVSAQNPLKLEDDGEPIPDFVLLRRQPDRYRHRHPTGADALMVIEVADSSVLLDRNVKSRLYARAGIPEYWVVDIPRGCVAVFGAPEGGEYAEQRDYCRGESWISPALGDSEVVADVVLDGPDAG